MDISRLHRGLAALGIAVAREQEEHLLSFLHELLRWNRRVNLTSITDEDSAVEKHLIDSLTLVPYLPTGGRLLDIGSGGGFPSLPLKIVRPDLEVVSVDAVQKKILFQRHLARQLRLGGFQAVHGRIESLADTEPLDRPFAVITSRALSTIDTFAKWARPFAGPETLLVVMKGREAERELEDSRPAMKELGFRLEKNVEIQLPFSGSRRHLLFFGFEEK